MEQKTKAAQFLALHQRDHPFVIPNPWDAGSAKILAAKGFEALATTSVGVDHSGGHSSGTAGRDEILANAELIARSTPLPVSIDLEDCYGSDATGIAETIHLAATTGAVGGSIEDVMHGGGGIFYPFQEAVDRVKAAVQTAATLPFKFTLTARCENHLFGRLDLEDTIARLKAFEEAGADVLYAPGLTTIEQIKAVTDAVSKPVNVLLGLGETTLTMADMYQCGVTRVSLGSALHRVAMSAMLLAVEEIQENGTFDFTEGLATMNSIDRMMKG